MCGGAETGRYFKNGAYVLTSYDTYGRIASVVNKSATGATLSSFAYTYDLDGMVERVDLPGGYYITYTHDGAGRLTDEHKKNGAAQTVYHNEYTYDAAGNRTSETHGGVTYTYDYNDLNQLTSKTWTGHSEEYSYDLNGNLSRKVEKVSGATSEFWDYAWDHENRLVQVVKKNEGGTVVSTVEYAYCPACGGSRTHRMVKDATGNLLSWYRYESDNSGPLRVDERYDADDNGLTDADPWRVQRLCYNGPGMTRSLLRETIYEYTGPTSDALVNKREVYYHYDRMGNVAGLSGGNGGELASFTMDAYGSWDGQAKYTARRLTGKEYDPETELYFFEERWYDASAGRFISRDPARISVSTHLYAYVDASPMRRIDPTGGASIGCCGPDVTREIGSVMAAIEGDYGVWSWWRRHSKCQTLYNIFPPEFPFPYGPYGPVWPGPQPGTAFDGFDLTGPGFASQKTHYIPAFLGCNTGNCGSGGGGGVTEKDKAKDTIWMDGGCHPYIGVNYLSYGITNRLCGYSYFQMHSFIYYYTSLPTKSSHWESKMDWATAGYFGWPAFPTPSPRYPCKACRNCEHVFVPVYYTGGISGNQPVKPGEVDDRYSYKWLPDRSSDHHFR